MPGSVPDANSPPDCLERQNNPRIIFWIRSTSLTPTYRIFAQAAAASERIRGSPDVNMAENRGHRSEHTTKNLACLNKESVVAYNSSMCARFEYLNNPKIPARRHFGVNAGAMAAIGNGRKSTVFWSASTDECGDLEGLKAFLVRPMTNQRRNHSRIAKSVVIWAYSPH